MEGSGKEPMNGLTIGKVRLDNRLILAPMAGVTDLPFRLLCGEQGAGLVCMEMVSAKAVHYGDKKTESLLRIHPAESPVSLQLFGSDPHILSETAKRIEDRPFALLDFNMGCPMPKIVNNREGSALMKNPRLAEQILAALVKAVKKPVTVKIRKGFDGERANAVEIAKLAESCGVSAVVVHGRTREQMYGGKADWEIIRRCKEAVAIPVIGNGDVNGAKEAKRMFEETGCDGVMIGRAAQGNPWIFRETAAFLETGEELPRPALSQRKEMALRHALLALEYKGEYTGVREMRKHLAWYTSGLPGSARFRQSINTMESREELLAGIREIFREGT